MRGSGQTRRRLTADERAALDQAVRDVGPRLLAYVRSAYRGVLEPEDVVAEAFCRTAENVNAFLRCARPDLYLFMVGRNICRDALRRRAPLATPDERLNLRAAGGDEPARGVARDEEQRLLAAALDALPPAQREVVVLRVSSGMKFQEIAELLAVPLATALTRMHAGLRKLRERMGCVREP